MYKTTHEALDYITRLTSLSLDDGVDVAVLAPFTSLASLKSIDLGTKLKYGAQNMFWEEQGAFTGEISPGMLADLGCTFVIIGHSERRKLMLETDEQLNRKIKAALSHKIIPILCVGETLEEREQGLAADVVGKQLKVDLDGVPFTPDLVIAYEPIWAIGTGMNATAADAEQMSRFIRNRLVRQYGEDNAQKIRILYGGSVKPENIAEFMKEDDIDGALVGGASLDPDSFAKIVNYKF